MCCAYLSLVYRNNSIDTFIYTCTLSLFACYPVPNNLFEQSLSLLYISDSCGPVLTVTYEAGFSFFFLVESHSQSRDRWEVSHINESELYHSLSLCYCSLFLANTLGECWRMYLQRIVLVPAHQYIKVSPSIII